jgi:chemotaxis response regulator CheB
MQQSMMNEVVEAMLGDRRREATRQRRIAAARRTRRTRKQVSTWRVSLGKALITVGSSIGGRAVQRSVPRNVGGTC